MSLLGPDEQPNRGNNRNFTVAVGGKQFDPLEKDEEVSVSVLRVYLSIQIQVHVANASDYFGMCLTLNLF